MTFLSFGFDSFGQTLFTETVKKVLFTSWETTITLNDLNEIKVWGYRPKYLLHLIQENPAIQHVFGDPNYGMGVVTDAHEAVIVLASGKCTKYENIKDACFFQEKTILLTLNGILYEPPSSRLLDCVASIHTSGDHVLCMTDTGIFGIGSNRFSQLADIEPCQTPVLIEHFSGLPLNKVSIACGPFHSAVALEGDLYTFGLFKEGRLGWGEKNEDKVDLAVFLNRDGEEVEVDAVKVVCGSCHTLVLDNEGRIWSCGSNKYGQLGRVLKDKDYDLYFRQCTNIKEKAIDCFAGQWNSFVLTQTN
ncbi:regulator of chromosome condensation 1/beta-lactamase-inhibitor protein II [Sporodiniella umbellata]|nr:regulator of chromosome condensation 1/beta-lactamase-inhibitor protein II [Sporodiniella umbellata]